MAATTPGTRSGPRDQMVLASVLILIGVAGFVVQATDGKVDIGGIVVLLIGLGLLGAFASTRHYGYLIPAGILTGLGVGIVLQQALDLSGEPSGGVIVLGLGLGFVSIWVIGQLVNVQRALWWPLVPGGILTAVGAALLIGGDAVRILDWWGLILVAIGLFVLWRAFTASHQPR
jgi:hypothetical protein